MSCDCAKGSSHKNLFHAKQRLQTLLSMNVWLNSSLQWPSPTWEHCLVQGLRCFRSATSPSHESSWASKRIRSKSQAFWEHQPLFVAVFLKFLGFLFDQTAAPCGWFQLPQKREKKGKGSSPIKSGMLREHPNSKEPFIWRYTPQDSTSFQTFAATYDILPAV